MNYSLLLESILYYSPKFKNFLYKFNNEISKDILSIEGDNILPDISFLDVSDEGVITFSPMNQALNKIKKFSDFETSIDKEWNPEENNSIYKYDKRGFGPGVYIGNRNQIKLGKLIKNLFKNKYSDNQIEEFVNLFKAEISKIETVQIWEGKMIAKAYDTSEYKFKVGSLGNSCMNDKFDYLEFYYINPEVCKVVVLLEDDKIIARALLWKISSAVGSVLFGEDNKIMIPWLLDRVYSTEDYLVNKMNMWAQKQGYAHKKFNNSLEREEIIFNGQTIRAKLQVKANPPRGEVFPYMDTFSRYDIQKKILHNDSRSSLPGHILHSTTGSYTIKNYPKVRFIHDFKKFLSGN